MATVTLRGPCGHVQGELDLRRGLVIRKCRQCSHAFRTAVYHAFRADTGELVPGPAPRHEEARFAYAPKGVPADRAGEWA